jgi:hypothetical protein
MSQVSFGACKRLQHHSEKNAFHKPLLSRSPFKVLMAGIHITDIEAAIN